MKKSRLLLLANITDDKEAADAIKSVTALYGYSPEFLGIYAQVGAAAPKLNIHKENSIVNDKKILSMGGKYYDRQLNDCI